MQFQFSQQQIDFLDMALIVKHDYQTTFEKIDCRMRGIYGLGLKQWWNKAMGPIK